MRFSRQYDSSKWQTRFSVTLTANVLKHSSALIFQERLPGWDLIETSPRTITRFLTPGATTVKSSAQLTMAGMKNPRSCQKSYCSARAATNGRESAIRDLVLRWMIWPIFDGSAAVVTNGILGLASTLGSILHITGRKKMKKRTGVSGSCPVGAKSRTK